MASEDFLFSEISCSEEAAEQLLAQRPGLLHAKDSAGCTVLHWCAQKGYAKIAAQLLAPWTGLLGLANVLDTNRLTPMHHAAQEGHEALVTQLAVHTSCSAMLDPDWTVLHCALKRGRDKMVGHLLDHCPELIKQVTFLGFDGLYAAASQGYDKAIAELLARRPKLERSGFGDNPLHAAAREGHDKVITQLVDYNPSLLEHTAGEATTALHEAAEGGHVKIIEQLLTLCPKLIDAVTFNGSTPLHAATSSKCEKVLELLLARKPELIDALNQEGHTPLQSALRDIDSSLATLDCLFAAKPEQLYHVDREGNTLLHHVVASAWKFRFDREVNYTWGQFKVEADREPHIAKVWGMNPAAARIANQKGDTPFDLAVEIQHKTIELLQCAFSLDEIVPTFAKSNYPLERVRPTLDKQCESLFGVLGRDVPHVVFEYLGFKRNNKRKK